MGVGRATAIRLAQDGATVVLLARRKLLLDEVVETIGPSAVPIVTDVTSSHRSATPPSIRSQRSSDASTS